MNRLRIIIFIIGFVSPVTAALLQSADQPDKKLFLITRSKDADVIHYTLGLSEDGNLHQTTPVKIYWIKHSKGGIKEPLTRIQSRFSYGIRYIKISEDSALFKFVSFDNKVFELKKSDEGDFRVFTHIDENELEVAEIFVQFNGGSFLTPVISEVIVFGKDTLTGTVLSQNIRP